MKFSGSHTFPASVLATILVVSIVMLLGVIMLITLWDNETTLVYKYHYQEQQKANVESGFILYKSDSTLLTNLNENNRYRLYEEDSESEIEITRRRWGLYEVVTILSGNGSYRSSRLLGKSKESETPCVLYYPDKGSAVSVSGKTNIRGKVYFPRNGFTYSQVRSVFFSGEPMDESRIKVSEKDFPKIDRETSDIIKQLFEPAHFSPLEQSVYGVDFTSDTEIFEIPETLDNLDMKGNIILYTTGALFIGKDNRMENIIVVADKIEIEKGFRGSLQLFAKDSVIIQDHVVLTPGSGIFLKKENPDRYVGIGDHTEINGYIIIEGDHQRSSFGYRKMSNYHQETTARIRGLVYIDGIAELKGTITGSLYVRDSYYFSKEGYYSGLLYNVNILEQNGIPYPMWMEGAYQRELIKWLD